MLKQENAYDFKKDLLNIHKKNIRDYSQTATDSELELFDGIQIVLLAGTDVIYTAARDFTDYLYTTMELSSCISRAKTDSHQQIIISLDKNIGNAAGYMGSRITVTDKNILIDAYDERGAAQALYYLEDLMNLKKAPFLQKGTIERKALFSPRITQSPFGMYSYPDEAFMIMAHLGYDAIDLWLKDPYTDNRGNYIDIRLISERAAKYGIDIYVELYAPHNVHPDEAGAQEFYDNLYGELFTVCPLLKGITLLGEANQFQSKDPDVGKAPYIKNFVDNIPTGKTSPGWWPCRDYPQWIAMIQNAVYKYNPDADIIFWTYNWGFAPEEERVRLIENLPDGVSLMATWEMFHKYNLGDSVADIADYSLQFAGPGEYFTSEAIAAKKRGIKLYTMANSSGRAWDLGTIPYEPMPQQWMKRYDNMIKAHLEWGLCGLLENIHYGFHPSIISDLEKCAFFTGTKPLEESLNALLIRDFGKQNAPLVKKATALFSEAITHFTPSNEDQYGAFRVGPSFPLWTGNVNNIPERGNIPSHPHAMFGNGILASVYTLDMAGRTSLPGTRIFEEIKALQEMERLMQEGIEILENCENPTDAHLKLLNLAKFIRNSTTTGIHVKQHYTVSQQLNVAKTKENTDILLSELEEILHKERRNVVDTIPLVCVDSRLGWEPSMEYMCDKKCLEWKLRQLDYELNFSLPIYRKSNSLSI